MKKKPSDDEKDPNGGKKWPEGKKKKKPKDEEEDGEQEGRPDQRSDCAMARKMFLLSEAVGSCEGAGGGRLSPHWPLRTVGRRARPEAVPSPRLPRTAGKPPPVPGSGISRLASP